MEYYNSKETSSERLVEDRTCGSGDMLAVEKTQAHTSHHHTEETDAGLDRPLYLRNKLYDKTLKSENLLL